MRRIHAVLFVAGSAAVWSGAAVAADEDKLDPFEYPFVDLPWAERAEKVEAELRRVNLYEGHVLAHILLPPEGHPDRISGNHEDGMNNTGPYLAALCFKYAVTKDPAVRELAKEAAMAMEKMERVTGVPGCFSRSYYRCEKPVEFPERYFFPAEWHWSTTFEKTRWLGDPSSDSLTHLLEGCALYYDLVADEAEKKRTAALVDRVMTRVVTHNMRLTDVDGKMTLWGDFCPDSNIQDLNALLGLAHLKIAHHVTGNPIFDRKYRRLIENHRYAERAVMARILTGLMAEQAPWDNTLGLTGLYFLMNYETDRRLLGFYRASLERYRKYLDDRGYAWYDFLIQALSSDTEQMNEKSYALLDSKRFARLREKRADGVWQRAGHHFMLRYWMGRYYGLIGSDATGQKDATKGAKRRTDLMVGPPWVTPGVQCPEGMTYVPGGEFLMGNEKADDDESPAHRVYVKPFFIDVTEVTNAQWKKVHADHTFKPEDATKPVRGMTWEEAAAYAKAIGKRLPTEAEWEKAARGTDGRLYPWGNFWHETLVTQADAQPVAQHLAARSPYGCLDMAGNVWEWTDSWYEPYPGNRVPSEQYGRKCKVIRGGADFCSYSFQRSTHRYYVAPNTKRYGYAIGLRCVKDAPKK